MRALPVNAGDRLEATVTCRAAVLFVVIALSLPDLLRAAQPGKPAADLSGTWSVAATFKGPPGAPDGGIRATITFKQSDSILHGSVAFPGGRGGVFTGVVDDKTVTFTSIYRDPDRPGVMSVADFTGTIDGKSTIRGHVTMVSTGPGTYMRGQGPYVATRR